MKFLNNAWTRSIDEIIVYLCLSAEPIINLKQFALIWDIPFLK